MNCNKCLASKQYMTRSADPHTRCAQEQDSTQPWHNDSTTKARHQFPPQVREEATTGRPSAHPRSSNIYTNSKVNGKLPHTADKVTIIK